MNLTGVCKYCGQLFAVEGGENMTQAERDVRAEMQCNCDEARKQQFMEKSRADAIENAKILFNEDYPEIVDVLELASKAMASRKLEKVTIKTSGLVAANLSRKGTKFKVERTDQKKVSMET